MELFTQINNLTRLLSNVKNVAMAAVVVVLFGPTVQVGPLLIGVLSLSLMCSAIYAFNSLTDVELDKLNTNKKHHADAVLYFGKRGTLAIIWLVSFIALLMGLLINLHFVCSVFLLGLTNFLYSGPYTRFKQKPVLDMLFGGALTYPLRFAALWYTQTLVFPPTLILLALAVGKVAGFMLYKELERKIISHTRSTISLLSRTAVALTAGFLFCAAYGVIIYLYRDPAYLRHYGLMPIPDIVMTFLPLTIVPIASMYLRIFGSFTQMDSRKFRVYGLVGTLVVTIMWLTVFLVYH